MEVPIYRIYCSKCNKDQKRKMSWTRWLRYMATDRKSEGYIEIDGSFIQFEPYVCPFGHFIDIKKTKKYSRLIKNDET